MENINNSKPLDKQDIKDILKEVEEKAKKLSKTIKTNQIRNFYSKIIQIKMKYQKTRKWEDIETMVYLLNPSLAYAAGRQKKSDIYNDYVNFKNFIEIKIDQLMSSENKNLGLENFFMILESFVAYHKFHGGEDN